MERSSVLKTIRDNKFKVFFISKLRIIGVQKVLVRLEPSHPRSEIQMTSAYIILSSATTVY